MNKGFTGFLGDFNTQFPWIAASSSMEGNLAGRKSLVERFGKLPAGMSHADAQVVLQFLYGAFDKRAAKQVRILHPYWDEVGDDNAPPEMTVLEFSSWLLAQVA